VPPELIRALELAEAALADIGDADREEGDDLAWAEARAAQDLPRIRQALKLPDYILSRATTTPKVQTPTDADLYDLAAEHSGDPVPAMRSALALWGSPAVAQPEVEELTDKELKRLAWNIHAEAKDDTTCGDVVVRVCRAAIAADRARYGRPAVAPVTQPEPETGEELIELRKHFERILCDARSFGGPVVGNIALADHLLNAVSARYSRPNVALIVPPELIRALELAEAALADIRDIENADADRERGNDVAWYERRALDGLRDIQGSALNLWRDHSAVAPVAVSKRPWERPGWCDAEGLCWWCPPEGPAYWSMVEPAMVYGGSLLPHWAIPLPTTTQEPQL
jgi:hypothetical protein